ncbi:MAG TPA: BMP family ABC transporter substrate-binding protein [Firmicutes bacterium]|nr:BMP family ABC transporter substrate-binding protein [Bacillota bacterium]
MKGPDLGGIEAGGSGVGRGRKAVGSWAKTGLTWGLLVVLGLGLVAAGCSRPGAPKSTPGEKPEKVKVFGAFATPIEEPWDGVIHQALQDAEAKGQIEYKFTDNLGYSGDMERVLREVAGQQKPQVVLGDAFGNEEAVRRVAKDFPNIAFVFGSGLGPADPNMSVFDNWIHEPAYLCGLIAGKLTKTGKVGAVGGYPVPEVNRLVNAFIVGAREANPKCQVLVAFINSWFDPAAAKEAALAQINAGADILYAERFGVIEAAKEHGLLAFGNMSDQNSLAPDVVITGPVWDMRPTVQYVIGQVKGGAYAAQDLKDFSMMAKGGARLAPFHSFEDKLPKDVMELVSKKEQEIIQGLFRLPILEEAPTTTR